MPNPLIRSSTNPLNLIALIIIVGVLYFTRDICIPFVLAVLLSFVLSPVVSRLQNCCVPRVPAVFLVIGLLLFTLALGGWLVGGQLVGLAEKLPQYQANVHEKLKSFRTSPGGLVDRLNQTLNSYTKEIESIGSEAPAPSGTATLPPADTEPATTPVAVAVATSKPSKVAAIERLMLGVVSPMTTSGIIMILSLFMLIRQEDLRDRVIRLVGGGQLQVATQALDDAGARVSRYLLIQLIVNVSFGVCIGGGLFVIGVPYSFLWGMLAACLRFVPYFGAPIAAVVPLLLAFAAMPGWTAVVLTFVLFIVLELVIANVVEPWLYGSSARISPLAIVASAVFWSWLWGPVGLLLSMPLTVCLVVIGRHVPRLWYLSVILGDEPVLASEARFYQRLLAGDQAEAWELAEQKLRDSSLTELYDTLIIPALILAEEDRHRDELDSTHAKFIFQSIRDLLEDLAERPLVAPELIVPEGKAPVTARVTVGVEESAAASPDAELPDPSTVKVLCIPANDEADEMGALMLSHLLAQHGMQVDVMSFKTLASERLDVVEAQAAGLVCVSAVRPQALLHARYMCKRLRARCPKSKIVVGLWHEPEDAGKVREKLPAALADAVTTSLASAVARMVALASHETYRTDARAEPVVAAEPAAFANSKSAAWRPGVPVTS